MPLPTIRTTINERTSKRPAPDNIRTCCISSYVSVGLAGGAGGPGRDLVGALASVTTVVRDVRQVICGRSVALATPNVVQE